MNKEAREFLYDFAKIYTEHVPEAKDIMRANTCKSLNMAYKQLKTIQDRNKFYRRLKAFLMKGFDIVSLKGTQFEHLECEELTMWLKKCVSVYQNNDIPTNLKETVIMRMANALSL